MLEMTPEVVDKGFLLTSLRHFIDGLELDFARYAAEFDQSKQWTIAPTISFAVTPPHSRGGAAAGGGGAGPD